MSNINVFIILYSFIFGAMFASFASAIAWRTGDSDFHKKKDKKYSVIYGRSMCPHCEATLPWWALIPVISYIVLGGKCHNCKKKISIFYPLFEIFFGILAGFLAYNYLNNVTDIFHSFLFFGGMFALTILSFQDIWFGEISDKIALPAIVILFLAQLFFGIQNNNYIIEYVRNSLILFFLFGGIVIASEAMGGGDLRIFVLIGILLPTLPLILSLTIAFLFASIYGITISLFKKKEILHTPVKLIPFLSLGFALIAVWGNMIEKIIFN